MNWRVIIQIIMMVMIAMNSSTINASSTNESDENIGDSVISGSLASLDKIYISETITDLARVLAGSTSDLISTIAGNGGSSFSGDNGQATAASIGRPYGVALDASGNIYIAESGNNRIRKVTISTGIITTIVGTGTASSTGDNGQATAATLFYPTRLALDSAGNVYITDSTGCRIRKVTVSTGIITLIAGTSTASYGGDNGPATSAALYYPFGVALDSLGNVYIADNMNHRIRKVTVASGIISTIAGTGISSYSGDNGAATSATLSYPKGVTLDSAGNVYIADYDNNRIRKVTISTGIITTIAGSSTSGSYNGDNIQATAAMLNEPYGLSLDSSGNIYIADMSNNRIRKVTSSTGIISTFAGTGTQSYSGDNGLATSADLNYPVDVTLDASSNVYIVDYTNNRIRKVTVILTTSPTVAPTVAPTVVSQAVDLITTIAGTGATSYSGSNGDGSQATSAVLTSFGVSVDSAGNVYIADYSYCRIRKVTVSTGIITTIAGSSTSASYSGDNGQATSATLNYISGVTQDSSGNVYIADYGNNRVRKVTVSTGIITTITGTGTASYSGDNGPATSAALNKPSAVALDLVGNVYIADSSNQRIRKVTVSTGTITAIAGTGSASYSGDNGPATSAALNYPDGVAVDSSGNVYIADRNNCRVRKVTVSTGIITTFAGTGTASYSGDNGAATSAALSHTYGVSVDSTGNVYIADSGNNRIRKVTVSTGIITTFAGTGTGSYSGDNGPATSAALSYPQGVALDSSGNVYIADTGNNRVRKVAVSVTYSPTITPTTTPTAPTIAPTTKSPTMIPTVIPTASPTTSPTYIPPTVIPTTVPTTAPTKVPSALPTAMPTTIPTTIPTAAPTIVPSAAPTVTPTEKPTSMPTTAPSIVPSASPIELPTADPSLLPTCFPSDIPSMAPTLLPTSIPTSMSPTNMPSSAPTAITNTPSYILTISPSLTPSLQPSMVPSLTPTTATPSSNPTSYPTSTPTKLDIIAVNVFSTPLNGEVARGKIQFYLAKFAAYFLVIFVVLLLLDYSKLGKRTVKMLHDSAFASEVYVPAQSPSSSHKIQSSNKQFKSKEVFSKLRKKDSVILETIERQEMFIDMTEDQRRSSFDHNGEFTVTRKILRSNRLVKNSSGYSEGFYAFIDQRRTYLGCEPLLYPDGKLAVCNRVVVTTDKGVFEDFLVYLCNNHSMLNCIFAIDGAPVDRLANKLIYTTQNCIAFFMSAISGSVFAYLSLSNKANIVFDLLVTTPATIIIAKLIKALYTCPIGFSVDYQVQNPITVMVIKLLGKLTLVPIIVSIVALLILATMFSQGHNFLGILLSFFLQVQLFGFFLEIVFALLMFTSRFYMRCTIDFSLRSTVLLEVGRRYTELIYHNGLVEGKDYYYRCYYLLCVLRIECIYKFDDAIKKGYVTEADRLPDDDVELTTQAVTDGATQDRNRYTVSGNLYATYSIGDKASTPETSELTVESGMTRNPLHRTVHNTNAEALARMNTVKPIDEVDECVGNTVTTSTNTVVVTAQANEEGDAEYSVADEEYVLKKKAFKPETRNSFVKTFRKFEEIEQLAIPTMSDSGLSRAEFMHNSLKKKNGNNNGNVLAPKR